MRKNRCGLAENLIGISQLLEVQKYHLPTKKNNNNKKVNKKENLVQFY